MESHLGHAGIEILKKRNIGFEDNIRESSAERLSLKPWDWMRKQEGWDRAVGMPTHEVRRKRSRWRREGRGRLGGGERSMWNGPEERETVSHEEKV